MTAAMHSSLIFTSYLLFQRTLYSSFPLFIRYIRDIQKCTASRIVQYVLQCDDSPTGILACPTPLVVSTWLNSEICFCPTIRGCLRSDDDNDRKKDYYCWKEFTERKWDELFISTVHKHLDWTKLTLFPQFLKHNLDRFHWQFSWNLDKDWRAQSTHLSLVLSTTMDKIQPYEHLWH